MPDADDATIGTNVAAFANGYVCHRRVHDHASTVDEGGPPDPDTEAIVDVERWLDKGSSCFQRWVSEGHIVGNGRSIIAAVAGRTNNAVSGRVS